MSALKDIESQLPSENLHPWAVCVAEASRYKRLKCMSSFNSQTRGVLKHKGIIIDLYRL
jgi:hypothetical protein